MMPKLGKFWAIWKGLAALVIDPAPKNAFHMGSVKVLTQKGPFQRAPPPPQKTVNMPPGFHKQSSRSGDSLNLSDTCHQSTAMIFRDVN